MWMALLMEFSHKKLPSTAAAQMRICPLPSVEPFALMVAPVYVFLRRNQKFVAVKAPLDFFTPEELERLSPMESLFFTDCVDASLRFRETARKIRALIAWKPVGVAQARAGEAGGHGSLDTPSPFEISDAILRMIGPLWGNQLKLEPFFATVFSNELCDLFPRELLSEARDRDVAGFERAVMRSSWAVFLALHLGFSDLAFLNRLRKRVFDEVSEGKAPTEPRNEVDELIQVCRASLEPIEGEQAQAVDASAFADRPERAAQRIAARLDRVRAEHAPSAPPTATIYGPGGFVDV